MLSEYYSTIYDIEEYCYDGDVELYLSNVDVASEPKGCTLNTHGIYVKSYYSPSTLQLQQVKNCTTENQLGTINNDMTRTPADDKRYTARGGMHSFIPRLLYFAAPANYSCLNQEQLNVTCSTVKSLKTSNNR